ncbi:aldehyde dehydrogenase [Amylostereum chailletii]|nr:aldehyde dehydrogenase [Amylostereum chailletii]
MSFVPLFVDGQRRPSSTGATFAVHNAFTKDVVGTVAAASLDDCVAAIEAAHKALPAWEATSPLARMAIFMRASEIMESEAWRAKMYQAITEETATATPWTAFNTFSAGWMTLATAAYANELKGESFVSTVPGGHAVVQRRAQGVVYSMVPWNAPSPLTIRATVLPAICGNTVLLRPSEFDPRTQSLLVEAFAEAGLPPGVINFIPMAPEDTPTLTPAIIAHPLVRAVNFTGSTRIGKLVALECAKQLKPCILELGGKAPAVVLADADIEQAARGLVAGGLMNTGQVCMSTERIIVEKPVLGPLVAALKRTVGLLQTGSPSEGHLSAVHTEASAERVVSLLQDAKDAGADIVLGDVARKGAVVKPHLVVGVKRGMKLWEEESFGPVLSVTVADSADHAVDLANDSECTLVSSLWTKDVHKALNIARRIRAGSTNINGMTIQDEVGLGIGGLGGASGYGRFDVDHFTDKRIFTFHPVECVYPGFLPSAGEVRAKL